MTVNEWRMGFFSFDKNKEESLVKDLSNLLKVKVFKERLSKDTALLANDCNCLCLFVQDEFNLEDYPQVQWIILRATGSDRIHIGPECKLNRVVDYGPQSIAEFTLRLILQLAHPAINLIDNNTNSDSERFLIGKELKGKKAAVIGVGRIGALVAHYLQALSMEVVCYDLVKAERELKYADSLEDALGDAFVVSLHLPLTEETKFILHHYEQLPRGCILVNTGRSDLIDPEKVILNGIKQGHFFGVGLDVYPGEEDISSENPFLKQIKVEDAKSNIIITNHVAYLTMEALGRIHLKVIEIVKENMQI